MTTLHIHIGTHKTGTTYIQKSLSAGREMLRERGLLYPEADALVGKPAYRFSHWPVARRIQTGGADPAIGERLAELCGEDCAAALLSGENFWGIFHTPRVAARGWDRKQRFVDDVKASFDGFDVRIVVYLRRHVGYLVSHYNQAIKQTAYCVDEVGPGINGFLADFKRLFEYERNLSLWADAFGDDKIVVREFSRERFETTDLVEDLLALTGTDATGLPRAERQNESWAFEYVCLKNELNKLVADDEARRLQPAFLKTVDPARLFAPDFTAAVAGHIDPAALEAFESDWQAVWQRFGAPAGLPEPA